MGFEYYYVVIAVVILKVLIWMCVLYFRAERLKRARAQRSFIIVDSHTGHSSAVSSQHRQHNDQSAIIDFEEAPATSQGPPSYDQAMSNCEDKPPPYSQVVSEGLPEITTPAQPQSTPPSETNSPQREITQ